MPDDFNNLTPAQHERLAMLFEECAEVIQIIGKIMRHGYNSYHPDDKTHSTNRCLLAKELRDVHGVLKAMQREELKDFELQDVTGSAWEKKLRYAHHQGISK